jgi:hypothetical protein
MEGRGEQAEGHEPERQRHSDEAEPVPARDQAEQEQEPAAGADWVLNRMIDGAGRKVSPCCL